MTAKGAREGAFISYAREDGEAVARALQARFTAEVPDVPVWLDRHEIEGGVGWWNQVEEQLDRAEFLILVMTPAALRSDNTRREWRSARQRGVCVYPVKGSRDCVLDYASLPSWMRKAHFYDPDAEWPKLVAHLRRGCRATRVPFMAPPLPAGFVARPREMDALIELLLTRDAKDPVAITTALRGAGGFGKTTLAAAICHDDRVIQAFDDGILWVTLGQSPNLLNELVKLYAALTAERPGFVDAEDAARELALRLENKNCLIVIDDAWRAADVKPFVRDATGCARLITTRIFDVAREAEAKPVNVDEMAPSEALELLLARAGIAGSETALFRGVVERLSGWPLPIKLAGSVMRQQIERGATAAKALDYVVRALDRRGIVAFDRPAAGGVGGVDGGREDAVATTIGASLNLLTPDQQRRWAELSIFPEDTAVPLASAAALWNLDELDTVDLASTLDGLALLEFDLQRGMVRMHDVLRSFAGLHLADPRSVHDALLRSWGDPHQLPHVYAWRYYGYHLRHAGRDHDMRVLLLDPEWLEAKLLHTNIHTVIDDFGGLAVTDTSLAIVRDALRLSASAMATRRPAEGASSDVRQLRVQLVGRLLGRQEPEVVALRDKVVASTRGPWLRLLHPTLDAPGGMLLLTIIGHDASVTSLAIDAHQRSLITASEDGSVRVWDLRTGEQLQVFYHRTLGARAVAVSDSAEVAVSGGADGVMYAWDCARGCLMHSVSSERLPAFTAVALSGAGTVAVSGSRDRAVRVWDVQHRESLLVLAGHREPVTSVAISVDGTRAVSASDDGTVRVWNLQSAALERILDDHNGPVNAVSLSADARYALSGSSDRTIKLWDVMSGRCLRTLSGHTGSVTSVSLASSARRALSGSSDNTARLWDLQTGSALATLDGHTDVVTAVALGDDGRRGATASADRSVKLWRFDEPRPTAAVAAYVGGALALVFSPDGRLCASGGEDGRIIVRDVESGREACSIDAHTSPVRSLAFTADGACVLSAGVDHNYWMWTVETGESVSMPVRHMSPVDYVALSETARYLTTGCADRFVYLWDVPSGVIVERYGTRRLFDHLIAPAPQRRDLPDTDEYRDMYLPGEPVYDVVVIRMSRDGAFAVLSAKIRDPGAIRKGGARSSPGTSGVCLLVLHIATGEVHSVSARQLEPVSAFAIDVETRRLLWAKADHTLELWDLRAEKRQKSLSGHWEKVNAVAFTPDGRFGVSCARDRSVRVWDLESGNEVASFVADSALRSLAISPVDDIIAAGDVSGRIHFLRLTGL